MLFSISNRKGSIEVTTSFLVKIIIAFVVFGFGLVIVRNIFDIAGSDELTREIDDQVERQISALMDTGERLLVFPEHATVSNGEVTNFGLGILNVYDIPAVYTVDFDIDIECHSFIDQNDELIDCNDILDDPDIDFDPNQWTFEEYPTTRIGGGDEEVVAISMQPSGGFSGTYIFNVIVTYDSDHNEIEPGTYGIVKLRLTVE